MSSYRSLNRFILAKLETTSGVDSSPTPGSNAVLVEAPDLSPDLQTTTTNEVTGALDKRSPISTSGSRHANFKIYLRGSGVAGTAPRLDPLMQACGLQPQTLAADSTGTAQAGSATTITLAAGGPSVDLTGFVVELTSGAGAGQKASSAPTTRRPRPRPSRRPGPARSTARPAPHPTTRPRTSCARA
jgi:hypothetical protein